MARQVLPIAGAIIGSFFGAPQIGYAIGAIIGNAVDPQVIKGPKLGEAGLQTSAEGVFRPIVLGTAAVKGNVIERGNRQVHTKRTRQSKGGGPISENDRVYWTFAIRVCEAPRTGIAGILRIWEDEKLVYDVRPESTIPEETAEFSERIRIYLGDEGQLPDPDLEAYKGIGNVNAYRGSAYIVFPEYDLTDRAERIPDYRFEVVSGAEVSVVDVMAFQGQLNNRRFMASSDGQSWSGVWTNIGFPYNNNYALATKDRYLTYGPSSPIIYTGDGGTTWHESEGGSNNAARNGWVADDGTIIIPDALGEMRRSIDNASSFQTIAGSPTSPAVVHLNGRWIAYHNSPTPRLFLYSETNGSSWVTGASAPVFNCTSRWASESMAAFSGSIFDVPNYLPCAIFTLTGQDSTVDYLPFPIGASTGEAAVPCICFGNGRWVAASTTGVIAYKDDSGWHVSDDDFGVEPRGITFNGKRFVMVGGIGQIVIKSSVDGNTWQTGYSASTASEVINSIAALKTQVGAQGLKLSTIVSFLHGRAGHSANDSQVSALTDTVDGIVFAGDYTCGDAIRTLMPIYMFDSSEHDAGSGYRINYVKRGGPVVATLTEDDLVDEPEEAVREDSLERPRVLHMHFENPLIGYAPAKASPQRISPDVLVTGEVTTQVPVVFGNVDEAWQRADVMLKVAWTEVAGEQKLTIPDSWLELCPTDNIGLVLRDQVRRLRFTEMLYQDGTLQCKLMADRQSAYTSNLTGIALPAPTPPLPSIVGPTVSAVLDIPALTDNGDRLLYYHAGQGQTPAWYGYQLQRKQPSASEFEDVVLVSRSNSAVMGELLDAIPASSAYYTDTTNAVRVRLYTEDVLDSLTNQQFLSEGGAFALENDDGTWEVMQYRDSQDDGDREWTLTTLLRGRLNTGGSAHSAGARFVLLDTVTAVDAVTAWIGQDLTHRAVSLGQSPELAAQQVAEYTAQSQREWPVAHLFGEIDGNSLQLSCVPRHRFGTEDHPVQSINHDGYRWTATDGSNASTADTAGTTHTFDVTGWTTPITVTVAQLNRYTGAGPTVTEEIQ